jgi:hypothetical protein
MNNTILTQTKVVRNKAVFDKNDLCLKLTKK